MKNWISGIYLLCISAIFVSALPGAAQSQVQCSTWIRSGQTFNWISVVNGNLSKQGTLTIDRVRTGGIWSGTLAFTSINAPPSEVTGEFGASQMEMFKRDTTQRWEATCFDGFIAGQFDRNRNDIFILFPRR